MGIGMHVCCSLVVMVLRGPFLYLIETHVASLVKGLKRNRGHKNCLVMHVCFSLVVLILKRQFLYLIGTAVAIVIKAAVCVVQSLELVCTGEIR